MLGEGSGEVFVVERGEWGAGSGEMFWFGAGSGEIFLVGNGQWGDFSVGSGQWGYFSVGSGRAVTNSFHFPLQKSFFVQNTFKWHIDL